MSDLHEQLHQARNLYAGASRKAARAWGLLERLAQMRVWLPLDSASNQAAQAIYYSAAYDACENYESPEEFATELREHLKNKFEVELRNGQETLCIKPFYGREDSTLLRQMGLGYLRIHDTEKLALLNVPSVASVESGAISGISDQELDVLTSHYMSRTLELLNTLRHLRTALNYVESGLVNRYNVAPAYPDAEKDEGIERVVAELVAETTMPLLPPPVSHFSSSSDTHNRLRTLSDPSGRAWLTAQ